MNSLPLTITSFNVRYPFREPDWEGSVPFIIVNATLKIDRNYREGANNEYDWGEQIWQMAKGYSEKYRKAVVVDDPVKEDEWYMAKVERLVEGENPNDGLEDYFKGSYPGMSVAYEAQESVFRHIEKFDTFWFREWISYCPVTEAIVHELSHYRTFGKLPAIYRGCTEQIVLRHFEFLSRYWD